MAYILARPIFFSLQILFLASGELYSWGHGGYGQLGHVEDEKTRPVLVPLQKKVIQIACGSYHSIALTEEGEVKIVK